MYKFIFNIMALLFFSNILCHNNKNEDKLLLSPVELIDLVRQEQHKNQLKSVSKSLGTEADVTNELEEYQFDPELEELCEDVEALRSRKVWSRWSKWGDCSVTCGGGTIARYRVCVAGRCAHGEREEQQRPCSRPPCRPPDFNITEEMHELD